MRCRREVLGETLGTCLLVLFGCGSGTTAVLFGAHQGLLPAALVPVFIGLTVTSVICLVAPLTQAGLNPAGDLGLRLVAWLAGWDGAAFPDRVGGFFHVYVLSPVVGAVAAARFFVGVLELAMRQTPDRCCGCKEGEAS